MPQNGWPRKLPPVSYLFYRINKHAAVICFKINNLETRPVQQINPNNIFSSKNVQKCSEDRRPLKIKADRS